MRFDGFARAMGGEARSVSNRFGANRARHCSVRRACIERGAPVCTRSTSLLGNVVLFKLVASEVTRLNFETPSK